MTLKGHCLILCGVVECPLHGSPQNLNCRLNDSAISGHVWLSCGRRGIIGHDGVFGAGRVDLVHRSVNRCGSGRWCNIMWERR